VTITHPFHPLRGQQVEVIYVRRGSDPDLIIRHPDGFHAAVAMSSTDYGFPPSSDPPFGPFHLLDVEGLCQAVRLIDRLGQAKRSCEPDDDEPCPPTVSPYDGPLQCD
jgi:hypothetical protein